MCGSATFTMVVSSTTISCAAPADGAASGAAPAGRSAIGNLHVPPPVILLTAALPTHGNEQPRDGALARREPHGVWGGEIFEQGTITARKAPRGRPPHESRRTPC